MQILFILLFLLGFYWLKLDNPDRSKEFAKNHKVLNVLLHILMIIGFACTVSFLISPFSCVP